MSATLHLWFNGEGVVFPQNNDWEKFQELDAVRTFLICADSWKRAGWNVSRMTTDDFGIGFRRTPFRDDGRVSKQYHWYSQNRWQFIAKALSLATEPNGVYWFCSFDVINNGYMVPGFIMPPVGCVTFQREHFSLSFFCATRAWLLNAESILMQYDQGGLPEIPRTYVSDEGILRQYAKFQHRPLQAFALDPEKQLFPLTHYARSTVAYEFKQIPTSY